jgi:hypothetical protein
VTDRIAEQMKEADGTRQQHLIHLGDVYYGGAAEEYASRMVKFWPPAAKADQSPIGSWSLNGNHDMYSGGQGYFDTLLRQPFMLRWHGDAQGQPSSFFLIEDPDWQVFGLDTSWNLPSLAGAIFGRPTLKDYGGQNGRLTVEQVKWMTAQRDPAKGCILLTHHQPASSRTNEDQHSDEAVAMLKSFGVYAQIDAWIWGHEHRCAVFKPQAARDKKGRLADAPDFCALVGHGGVPVPKKNFGAPELKSPDVRWEEDRFDSSARIYEGERVLPTGFARIETSPGSFDFRLFDYTGAERFRQVVKRGQAAAPTRGRGRGARPDLLALAAPVVSETPVATIEIGLVKGGIESVHSASLSRQKIDAIAVGHYVGVKPQAAERRLDEAVTAALLQKRAGRPVGEASPTPSTDLVLTLLTERGTFRGELGRPFILPDPRDPNRLIVLAGMGVPGHFGVPELAVLAQELCWTLGRLEKRHLATVLIGAGAGNLSIEDAIGAWLRGIRRALSSSSGDVGHRLCRITFVENDANTFRQIDHALRAALAQPDPALAVRYAGPGEAELAAARQEALQQARAEAEAEFDHEPPPGEAEELVPVRITVGLQRKTYQFAAMTKSASVPQREIPLDPRLVNEANDELANAEAGEQESCGRFLERLLLPEEFRATIYTPAPIVLALDATTARLHWEMIARTGSRTEALPIQEGTGFDPNDFLGTSYGLTRQLRTTFAPAPEPPPPPQRTLRVLVIADPAADAPLPGARAEAEEVASTFERFNQEQAGATGHSVEVVCLFGPEQAKRTTVLKKLMLEKFDVLHYAGHCVYDEVEPLNSGWIFSVKDDLRITANELQRIDRVPRFIFSNACESGITPDRADLRNAAMAPSFAEAFFARGVADFVCTAWPVDDEAARLFASRLYGELLGLTRPGRFAYMHHAMCEARRAVASTAGGARTWGAYQHYGNPYLRFFDHPASPPAGEAAPEPTPSPAAARRRAAPKTTPKKRSATKRPGKPH